MDKTHYRKAFNSPYLSSADIVEPTDLTISHVRLEPDKTKKTKDLLNTAYFKEREIRNFLSRLCGGELASSNHGSKLEFLSRL